eukprot:CCRYP_009479-RA/>CCRYP_009479-RA protein AED:0.05 eAED:0.05 QI:162/1/0.5/1/1/1/2/0/367
MVPITSRISMPYTLALFLSATLSIIPVHHAFHTPTAVTLSSASTASTRLSMINVFGGGELKEPQLPKDVKDAISKCRGAVQKGLENRISRMDVEMPVGANFGVENKKTSKNKRGNLSSLTGDDSESSLTLDKLDTSNRELARLFVEMFQPLGSSHICTVFNDEYLADQARERWSDDISAECNIVAIDRKGKRSRGGLVKTGNKGMQKKKKAMGFAAKIAAELEEGSDSGPFSLPKETEVALFVAPGPKELIAIERICNEVGMGTCVILLNARLSLIDKFVSDDARKLFLEEFEPIWSLSAAPQDEAPGCLMHRAYPGPWMLARKPKVGAPKTIAIKQGEKFSGEECKDAFGKVEISELERGTERLAE